MAEDGNPVEPNESLCQRDSHGWRGASGLIGTAAARLRDAVAAGLIAIGVGPNMLTVSGSVLTCVAGLWFALGAGDVTPWEAERTTSPASWRPLTGAIVLTVACAMDVLDGAVARLGRLESGFGAVLDSTLDRLSDSAVFMACAVHFAWTGNVTYVCLSLLALANAYLISYVKARAENVVNDCGVGTWQRGERCVVFLFAAYVGHIPTALWLMSVFPMFTVVRRLRHTHVLAVNGQPREPAGWTRVLTPWGHPRGSIGYNLSAGVIFGFLTVAPWLHPFFYGQADPVRTLLDAVTAA